MTSREKIVLRILMFMARAVNDNQQWAEELKQLETHINVERWKDAA